MSTGVDVYSTTPANNGTIGGTGYFPEGQAPSTVNDAARQVMADVAAWVGQAKVPDYLTGVAGTNTVTAGGPSALAAYAAGQSFILIPAATNTGATTVNITPSGGAALGAKNVFLKGTACIGGELLIGVPVFIVYDGTQFNIIGPSRPSMPAVQATTSGTAKDFLTIPSWVRRITLNLAGVSTNGTNAIMVQIGISSGVETSGYVGTCEGSAATGAWLLNTSSAAAGVYSGSFTITLLDPATNTWAFDGNLARTDVAAISSCAGYKPLAGTLDRVRFTTNGGTDTFDAGSVNIVYD